MVLPAVRAAFTQPRAGSVAPSSAPSARPTALKGGLDVLFHVQLGEHLERATLSPCRQIYAAASIAGSIILVEMTHGTVLRRSEEPLGGEPPNALAWSLDSTWLVGCSDDGHARVVSVSSGAVVCSHAVSEEPEPGKRRRCVACENVVAIADSAFVAAAGTLVHACEVPSGRLRHTLSTGAPVRGLCRSPSGLMAHWAYAAAYKGGVVLVSSGGAVVCQLSVRGHPRSLSVSDQWLAVAAFDGSIALWDVAKRAEAERPGEAERTCNAFCGTDGAALEWSTDGGGLAASGKRVAVIDFTGRHAPPHPYASAAFAAASYQGRPGEPDPVPRVCMGGEDALFMAWAPPADNAAATTLATAREDGVVQLWRPWEQPLRKGGVGNPDRPQLMKPQFYTFLKADATHPSGDASQPCGVAWLDERRVAVCYEQGDLVARTLAPVPAATQCPLP